MPCAIEGWKVCPRCGRRKGVGEFNRNNAKKDGLFFRCRACQSDSYKAYYHERVYHGRIGGKKGPKTRPATERFWEKVGPHNDPTKCWLWTAGVLKAHHGSARYGLFSPLGLDRKTVLAHRFSYELHYGVKIPSDMTIDHVKARGCINTLCVNPYHLEVVTSKVNTLRGDAPSANHARQTMCVHGHPFDEENTLVCHGQRICRACHRERRRKRYQEGKG